MRPLVAALLLSTLASAAPPTGAEREALLVKLAGFEATAATDPKAGCNAGWLQFQLGLGAEAKTALDRAIAQLQGAPSPDVKVLGACLYNRGRVAEGRGDIATARADYRSSLAVRPNTTVSKRLNALGPELSYTWQSEKAGAGQPLPAALRAVEKDSRCAGDATPRGKRCEFDQILSVATPGGAFTARVLRQRVTHRVVNEVVLYLAVETTTTAVVYVDHPITAFVPNPPIGYHAVDLEMGDYADALGPLVIVKLKASRHDVEGGSRHVGADALFVIALDDRGSPSVRAIDTLWDEIMDDNDEAGRSWSLSVDVGASGKSVVKAKSGRLSRDQKALLGSRPTRALGFPLADFIDPLAL
ncbi:MAG: tetratricopeptide repeat protein [Myxococcales bacterium]|nr:tetratricopeptide repeat protein [Myxococcales bacterium]